MTFHAVSEGPIGGDVDPTPANSSLWRIVTKLATAVAGLNLLIAPFFLYQGFQFVHPIPGLLMLAAVFLLLGATGLATIGLVKRRDGRLDKIVQAARLFLGLSPWLVAFCLALLFRSSYNGQ